MLLFAVFPIFYYLFCCVVVCWLLVVCCFGACCVLFVDGCVLLLGDRCLAFVVC